MNYHDLDTFTAAYVEALLWSSVTDNGHPVDDEYGWEDISEDDQQKIIQDCRRFQNAYGDLFQGKEDQAGHDYALTRNHHGAGFWDRSDDVYPKAARDILTQASHDDGEVNVFAETSEDGVKIVYVE